MIKTTYISAQDRRDEKNDNTDSGVVLRTENSTKCEHIYNQHLKWYIERKIDTCDRNTEENSVCFAFFKEKSHARVCLCMFVCVLTIFLYRI